MENDNRNDNGLIFFLCCIFQVSPLVRIGIIICVGTKYRETMKMVLCKRNEGAAAHPAQPRQQAAKPDHPTRESHGVTPNVSIIHGTTCNQASFASTRILQADLTLQPM